jgi:hypothetical protein
LNCGRETSYDAEGHQLQKSPRARSLPKEFVKEETDLTEHAHRYGSKIEKAHCFIAHGAAVVPGRTFT